MHSIRLPEAPVKLPARGIALAFSGGRWVYVTPMREHNFSRQFLIQASRFRKQWGKKQRCKEEVLWTSEDAHE